MLLITRTIEIVKFSKKRITWDKKNIAKSSTTTNTAKETIKETATTFCKF